MRTTNFLLCALLCATLAAGEPEAGGDARSRRLELVRRNLLRAGTGIRILLVNARPEDVDLELLRWLDDNLSTENHVLLLTRGESASLDPCAVTGAAKALTNSASLETHQALFKAWYANLPDFGYAPTQEEASLKWRSGRAPSEVVRLVRMVRPHVIIAPDVEVGDGCQKAAELLTTEAARLAASGGFNPPQLRDDGCAPWATEKVYLRTHNNQPTLTLDLAPKQRRCFLLAQSRTPDGATAGLFDGIKAAPDDLRQRITAAVVTLKQAEDRDIVLAIARALQAAEQADESVQRHLAEALAAALNLGFHISPECPITTPGQNVKLSLRVSSDGPLPSQVSAKLRPESAHWECSLDREPKELPAIGLAEFAGTVKASAGALPTLPREDCIFSRIETRRPLEVSLSITLKDASLPQPVTVTLQRPVALDLAPPVQAQIEPDPVLILDDPARGADEWAKSKFKLKITNFQRLKEPLKLGGGIRQKDSAPVDDPKIYHFEGQGQTIAHEFRTAALIESLQKSDVDVPTLVWSAQQHYSAPTAHLRRVPVALPERISVGLVRSGNSHSGAVLLAALQQLQPLAPAFSLSVLDEDAIAAADLHVFHTLILDNRAAALRAELHKHRGRLFEFMKLGGNIVCLQHLEGDEEVLNLISPRWIALSKLRLSDETAAVQLSKPEHALLLKPNRLWERDFSGWVQERGAWLPAKWSRDFTPLLSIQDDNHKAQQGGVLVSTLDAGSFIYVGLSLTRQLEAGVPGAYRLLANLISYPRTKQ